MKNHSIRIITGLALGAGISQPGPAAARSPHPGRDGRLATQRRPALDVLACPECHAKLSVIPLDDGDGYHCAACQKDYPVVDGIPHFIELQEMTGLNKRFAQMYNWFSWGYRAFSAIAFAYIGMSEEQARREVTDRLEPKGGRLLEISIGPG